MMRLIVAVLVCMMVVGSAVAWPADSEECKNHCSDTDGGNKLKCCVLYNDGEKCTYGNWALEVYVPL